MTVPNELVVVLDQYFQTIATSGSMAGDYQAPHTWVGSWPYLQTLGGGGKEQNTLAYLVSS